MKKTLIAVSVALAAYANANADEELKPSAWVPLPAIGSSPETGFQYGAYVMRIFPQLESGVPQNRLELLLQGTTQGQFQAYFWPNVYVDQGNWQVKGKLGGKYWPSAYFGQGNTSNENGDKYADTAAETSITLNYRGVPAFSFGGSLFAEYHQLKDISEEPGTTLLTPDISGAQGGLYSGIGINASYDTRDNIDWPTQGHLLTANWDVFTAVLGSELDFHVASLSVANYLAVAEDVLGVSASLAMSSEETPFTHLPKPTGDRTLRGANGNRWIDNSSLGLQGEYRKVLSQRWAVVGFVDTFQVAPTLADFSVSDFHVSTGLGVRFAMTPDRFNVRLDVGWVDAEFFNMAITVGEAF
jgi:hypothetical protein